MARFENNLNAFCNRIAPFLMMTITILQIALIIAGYKGDSIFDLEAEGKGAVEPFLASISMILFLCQISIGILFALNGQIQLRSFNKEIKKKISKGFPLGGIEGFDETEKALYTTFRSSYSIIILVVLAALSFGYSSLPIDYDDPSTYNSNLFLVVSIGLLLIAFGMTLLLRTPLRPVYEPGGLMNFYNPTSIPSTLDNILSDAFFTCLDPITRLKFDEWTHLIEKSLNPSFLSETDNQTRVEIAREKILLLIYLQKSMPDMMSQENLIAEIKEIIAEEKLTNFLTGDISRISLKLMRELLLPEAMKKIPEIWTLIDRIIVNLVDNLDAFKKSDLWITFGYPSIHAGTFDPFRIIIFALNQSEDFKEKKRPISFRFKGGRLTLEPDQVKKLFSLDPSRNFKIKSKNLSFLTKGGEDIVGSLSQILQIGDALWLQFLPLKYGPHVLNVDVEENSESRFSRSAIIYVKRDIKFFLKSYGGRATALSGMMLPMFKVLVAGLGIGFLFG